MCFDVSGDYAPLPPNTFSWTQLNDWAVYSVLP